MSRSKYRENPSEFFYSLVSSRMKIEHVKMTTKQLDLIPEAERTLLEEPT